MIKDHNEQCKKLNTINTNFQDKAIHYDEEFVKHCRTFMNLPVLYYKKKYRLNY